MARTEQAAPGADPLEPTPRSVRRRETFRALAHYDFRLLLVGNMFSQLGQWSMQVGKGWLVFELTGSPLQLGLVAFSQGVGMFLLAPLGGALADRFDRRRITLASQTVLMVVALTIAFIVITDVVQVWHLYITAFVMGGAFAINGPSRQSMVHDLVGKRDLTNAIALNSVTMNSMRVIGPSVGGVLVGTVGVEWTFLMQAGCYVAAMSTVLLMRQKRFEANDTQKESFFTSMAQGFSYARRDPTISRLLIIALISSSMGMAYMHLLPAYVGDVLDREGGTLGFLMTASGTGGLLAAAALTLAGSFRGRGSLLLFSVAMTGVMQIFLGGFGILVIAIPVLALLGTVGSINLVLNNTLLQTNVDDRYRGRVISLYFQTFSLSPLGALGGGAVAEIIGLQASLIIIGSIVTVSVLYIFATSPQIRRL